MGVQQNSLSTAIQECEKLINYLRLDCNPDFLREGFKKYERIIGNAFTSASTRDQVVYINRFYDLFSWSVYLPPLNHLELLSHGLRPGDNCRKIKQWLQGFNFCENMPAPCVFHGTLAKVVEYIKKHPFGSGNPLLPYLEHGLWEAMKEVDMEQARVLFEGADQRFIEWAASFKEGDRMGEYKLGKLLSIRNDCRYFAIDGEPTKILMIPKNRSQLYLEYVRHEQENFPIPIARMVEMDEKGCFALFEKLEESNSRYKTMVEVLKKFITLNQTPRGIPLSQFKSDGEQVRATAPYTMGRFNITVLSEYALEIGEDYKQLMRESGLELHPDHIRLKKFIEEFYDENRSDIEEFLAARYNLPPIHPIVVTSKKVVGELKKIERELEGEFPYSMGSIKKVIQNQFRLEATGVLRSGFKERVRQQYCDGLL